MTKIDKRITIYEYTTRKQQNNCQKDAWVNGSRKKRGPSPL